MNHSVMKKVCAALLASMMTMTSAPLIGQAETPVVNAQQTETRSIPLNVGNQYEVLAGTDVDTNIAWNHSFVTWRSASKQGGTYGGDTPELSTIELPTFPADEQVELTLLLHVKDKTNQQLKSIFVSRQLTGKDVNELTEFTVNTDALPSSIVPKSSTYSFAANQFTSWIQGGTQLFVDMAASYELPLRHQEVINGVPHLTAAKLAANATVSHEPSTKAVNTIRFSGVTDQQLVMVDSVPFTHAVTAVKTDAAETSVTLYHDNLPFTVTSKFSELKRETTLKWSATPSFQLSAVAQKTGMFISGIIRYGNFSQSNASYPITVDVKDGGISKFTQTFTYKSIFGVITPPLDNKPYTVEATVNVNGVNVTEKVVVQPYDLKVILPTGYQFTSWKEIYAADSGLANGTAMTELPPNRDGEFVAIANVQDENGKPFEALLSFTRTGNMPIERTESFVPVTIPKMTAVYWRGILLTEGKTYLVPKEETSFYTVAVKDETLYGRVTPLENGTLNPYVATGTVYTLDRPFNVSHFMLMLLGKSRIYVSRDVTPGTIRQFIVPQNEFFKFNVETAKGAYSIFSVKPQTHLPITEYLNENVSGIEPALTAEKLTFIPTGPSWYNGDDQHVTVEVKPGLAETKVLGDYETIRFTKPLAPGAYEVLLKTWRNGKIVHTESSKRIIRELKNAPYEVTNIEVVQGNKQMPLHEWDVQLETQPNQQVNASLIYYMKDNATGKNYHYITAPMTKRASDWLQHVNDTFTRSEVSLVTSSKATQMLTLPNYRLGATDGIFVSKQAKMKVVEVPRSSQPLQTGDIFAKESTFVADEQLVAPTGKTYQFQTNEEAGLYVIEAKMGEEHYELSMGGYKQYAITLADNVTELTLTKVGKESFAAYKIDLPTISTVHSLLPLSNIEVEVIEGNTIRAIGLTTDSKQRIPHFSESTTQQMKWTLTDATGMKVEATTEENDLELAKPLANGTYSITLEIPRTKQKFTAKLQVGPVSTNGGGTPPVVTPPTNGGGTPPVVTPPTNGGGTPPVVTPPTNGGGTPPVVTPPTNGGGTPPNPNQTVTIKPNEPVKIALTPEQKEAAKVTGFKVESAAVTLKVPAKLAEKNFTIEKVARINQLQVASNVKVFPAWAVVAPQLIQLSGAEETLAVPMEMSLAAKTGVIVKVVVKNGKLYALPQQTQTKGAQLVTAIDELSAYAVVTPLVPVKPTIKTVKQQTTYAAQRGVYYTTDAKLVAQLQDEVNLAKWKKTLTVKKGTTVYMVVEEDGLISVVKSFKK